MQKGASGFGPEGSGCSGLGFGAFTLGLVGSVVKFKGLILVSGCEVSGLGSRSAQAEASWLSLCRPLVLRASGFV